MIDERDLFDRAVRQFPPPDHSLDRLIARRARQERNRRIRAGAVALCIAAVGAVLALRTFSAGPRTTGGASGDLPRNGDVVFAGRSLSDNASLTLVDPDGGNPRTLLAGGCAASLGDQFSCDDVLISSLDWAPDGTHLVFSLDDPAQAGLGDHAGIYVLDVGTGEISQLTLCSSPCLGQGDVDWSPDGSRIAFTEEGEPEDGSPDCASLCSIFTMRADGTDRVPVDTGTLPGATNPSWSPDGRSIAFSARVGGRWFAFVVGLDGSAPRSLASDLGSPQESKPAWSPDGSRIAFLADASGSGEEGLPFDLWTIRPDGTDRRFVLTSCCRIGGGGFPVQGPEWSPDGTRILLLGGSGVPFVVIDPSTAEQATGARAWGPIAWRPEP